MKFAAAFALAFPFAVQAQYGGAGPVTTAAPSPTSAAAPAIPSAPPSTSSQMNIDVAPGGKLVFSPANITASNGTTVTFFFPHSLKHSVSQSSFAEPCTYLAAANSSSAGGFDSGLQSAVQFSITITDDTKPIWFHCKAPSHCGLGMVGSINAPASGNTFDAFQSAALAIGSSEQSETDNGPVTGGVNADATAAPAATFSASSSSSPSSGSGSSSGAARGVIASGVFAVAVAALAVVVV
ncbi:hypothetical protein FA95DRAFT_1488002 [Auriscalpium vulgare]|uniref:Uncharacterized protein n=1 Tax=Auriscalpium vulgare TaxID=40419 RepID=A0ACB8S1P1_9AGAM|nr:hypothetical protein FA95DRAFT_1488002 [Auriscalpium vulgare]